MRHVIECHDWSKSAVGAPAEWPRTLTTLVALIRASDQPMYVAWGDSRILIYNDAYAGLLGDKHPGAFGRPFSEVWSNAHPALAALVDRVFAGESVSMDDISPQIGEGGATQQLRQERIAMTFPYENAAWNDDAVLERYELSTKQA